MATYILFIYIPLNLLKPVLWDSFRFFQNCKKNFPISFHVVHWHFPQFAQHCLLLCNVHESPKFSNTVLVNFASSQVRIKKNIPKTGFFQTGCDACRKTRLYYSSCLDSNDTLGNYSYTSCTYSGIHICTVFVSEWSLIRTLRKVCIQYRWVLY